MSDEKCPKCGGASGYKYKRHEVWYVNGSWIDGEIGEEAEFDEIIKENKPRCIDCGKVAAPLTLPR